MYFDDDDEVEELEETMYEEVQTNLQSVTLTIDVNIVVKDLFKYIRLLAKLWLLSYFLNLKNLF